MAGVARATSRRAPASGRPRDARPSGVDVSGERVTQPRSATVDCDVLGPGDVTGIDPRQVIRRVPGAAGRSTSSPTYFAHVEFDRPDLPWLFTPHGSDADGTPAPVDLPGRRREGRARGARARRCPLPDADGRRRPRSASCRTSPTPTPGRTCRSPATPRLEPRRSRATTSPSASSRASSARARSTPTTRLHRLRRADVQGRRARGPRPAQCPATGAARRLAHGPALRPTRRAARLSPLGVHHRRRRRLPARSSCGSSASDELPGVGTRELDVTAARVRASTIDQAATPCDLGGALRVDEPDAPRRRRRRSPPTSSRRSTAPTRSRRRSTGVGTPRADGVNAPASGSLGWLEALNLDQRHRVAAGLGTPVVQERQEDLMAAAGSSSARSCAPTSCSARPSSPSRRPSAIVARHLAPLPDAVLLVARRPRADTDPASAPNNTLRARGGRELPAGARALGRVPADCPRPWPARSPARPGDRSPASPTSRRRRSSTRPRSSRARRRRAGRGADSDAGRRGRDCPLASPSERDELAPYGGAERGAAQIAEAVARPSGAERWLPVGAERRPDSDLLAELGPTLATLSARAARTPCSPLELGPVAATVMGAIEPDVAVAEQGAAADHVPRDRRGVRALEPARPDHGGARRSRRR